MTSSDRDDTATHALGGEATLRVHAATLDVASGPDAGRQARVDRPTFIIGSGPGADLRLTDGAVSRIVPRLSENALVTTPRNDTHYLVTEFGTADLKGKSTRARALAIIDLAHPSYRESLLRAAEEMYII